MCVKDRRKASVWIVEAVSVNVMILCQRGFQKPEKVRVRNLTCISPVFLGVLGSHGRC